MNREQFNVEFVKLGWAFHRDEVGDGIVMRRYGNKTISMVPQNTTHRVKLTPTLSLDEFDIADSIISDPHTKNAEHSIIIKTQIRLDKSDINSNDVRVLSEQVIDWALAQDVQAGLADLRALPTNCLGAMPVRHLAALAVAGDVETLTHYHDSFARGDRLDFVPYVDIEMIDRALAFARQRRDNPDWLPDTPRLRI